jgi:hypothetical protein
MIYAKGDLLSGGQQGNWDTPYYWTGYIDDPVSENKHGGPADHFPRFRAKITNQSAIEIGIGFRDQEGHRNLNINAGQFGAITGIWEIGPIIELDNWITTTLPSQVGISGSQAVQPPDPTSEYFVDYAIFYDGSNLGIESMSEEYNVPGFLGDHKYFVEGNGFVETHSNPGHMTVNLFGNNGGWETCPIYGASGVEFSQFPPPFEMETSFIPPDDSTPWNFWYSITSRNTSGGFATWSPGFKNIPGQGRFFMNASPTNLQVIESNPTISLDFNPAIPDAIINAQQVHMLIQVLDTTHLRVGFRADPQDPWHFSDIFDTTGWGTLDYIAGTCPVIWQGVPMQAGWGTGNHPEYQKFRIDFIRFRFDRTDNP